MPRRTTRVIASLCLVLCLVGLMPLRAAAWGRDGHQIVAGIALWRLQQGIDDPLAPSPVTGMTQLMYYAFGGDLTAPGTRLEPSATTMAGEGTDEHLAITYRRRTGLTDVEVTPQTSPDLVTWTDADLETLELSPPVDNGDGTETATVVLPSPLGETPRIFVRLRVSIGE